jgi:hypothetical protein
MNTITHFCHEGFLVDRGEALKIAGLAWAGDLKAQCIIQGMDEYLRLPAQSGEGKLCATCDYEFIAEKRPEAFYIFWPTDFSSGEILVLGICQCCLHLPKAQFIAQLEKMFGEGIQLTDLAFFGETGHA